MTPQIHLLAGLNGAGKMTLARQLVTTLPAVRFSLDEWMLRLFVPPDESEGFVLHVIQDGPVIR